MNGEYEDIVTDDREDDSSGVESIGVIDAPLNEPIPEGASVYHLQLQYSHETFFAVYEGAERLEPGSTVIVLTRFGRDSAKVMGTVRNSASMRVTRIERPANAGDMERLKRIEANEKSAFDICKEKILRHGLNMKLVRTHYLFEENKILFFFTSESRVDFRELVKDLVSVFKTRIELRQIGIRDESRIMGGCGICGRLCCCHTISDKLKPVSIKMAKEQNLSLNSMKISGSCGRLLCCLSYEHAFYSEERKNYPPEGERMKWDNTTWRVREINPIADFVLLDAEDGRTLTLPKKNFSKSENRRWNMNGDEIAGQEE